MKILIDVMGGDNAPQVPVEAAVKAANELGVHMVLIGDTDTINNELKKYTYPEENISIVHASEVISNHEEPAKAVRRKKVEPELEGKIHLAGLMLLMLLMVVVLFNDVKKIFIFCRFFL